MKKVIIGMIVLLVLIAGFLFMMNNEENIDEASNDSNDYDLDGIVELRTELRIKSLEDDLIIEIDETEEKLFLEDKLIPLKYLKGMHRFLYDHSEDNQLILVYEDQTLIFDLNAQIYTLNYSESFPNDILFLKAGILYIDIEAMSRLFNIEYFIIEEPFVSIQIDFNSDGQSSYLIKDLMQEKLDALPEHINMTWEAVYSSPTNIKKLYDMPGLDIISPVWYKLEEDLKIKSKKQDDYIAWANLTQYMLWPAITNDFDTDLTHELITSLDNRSTFIQALVELYSEAGFPGINIDFENIYKTDKESLSQFIAELTAAFHRENIIVSMDITFAGGSDTWSKCYDRLILGQWVDFVVVMSYDQHWGSSPDSGTVAGLDWVDENIGKLTNDVEGHKIIMGIPFYMRVWFERPSKDTVNSMKVTSDAITMHAMENILSNNEHHVLWDDQTGQNYISYIDIEDQAVKKIWIEDAESLSLKVDLVHKYGLKGIASWRRGYELESIWPILEEALRKGE